MEHSHFFIDISEKIGDSLSILAGKEFSERIKLFINTHNQFTEFMAERGYESFEKILASSLETYLETELNISDEEIVMSGSVSNYVSCIKKDSNFIFCDIEAIDNSVFLEIDIFSDNLSDIKERIIDDSMRCFGLTKSKDDLIKETSYNESSLNFFKDKLVIKDSLIPSLFQKVKEKADRDILRELRKRGSVLERDLADLQLPGLEVSRIKSSLDYFSGEEYKLIDRKYAIVCNKTNEIIFLARDKKDLEGNKILCPKCSNEISKETCLSYYESTENLKQLLDGSRWMPLLIRDALIASGVSPNAIFTEVKHGNDEIDVLAFYRQRIYVIEAKDRPVNLNDAYKLSAKTSHLENSISDNQVKRKVIASSSSAFWGLDSEPRRRKLADFIPIIISTCEISSEATELLKGTNNRALFLDDCETKLTSFIHDIIKKVEDEETRSIFADLVFKSSPDSISNYSSELTAAYFTQWYKSFS